MFLPDLAALRAPAENRVDVASEDIVEVERSADLRREHDAAGADRGLQGSVDGRLAACALSVCYGSRPGLLTILGRDI